MRSVSGDQFNESAQSNQQDLIGEMKTNRQQKASRGSGLFVQADRHPRKAGIGQDREGCRKLQIE
jgi:hypothetical protein